jgi:hypothetical protein
MLLLKVVERGERGDHAAKRRMRGNVIDALAADVNGASVAQAVDELLAGADSHRALSRR